jgi:glucose/arabinose dehydrogenase
VKYSTLIFIVVILAACTGTPVASTPPPAPTLVPTALAPPSEAPTATLAVTAEPAPPTAVQARTLPEPSTATWSRLVTGLVRPVDLQHAGDERLFIVEQRGLIWVLREGELDADPFLDIRAQVNDRANEQGLLGLAFPPAYALEQRFFVYYTDAGGSVVISEYHTSTDPDRADANSERVLLTIAQPYANHNGGGLAFGPDGYLYIGTGDGGSAGDPAGNAQNPATLLGKLLRVDVAPDAGQPYGIPPDNPFAAGGGRAEIWALGLRNPWRFAFDPEIGDLFIADVGQNQWEEVNFQPAFAPGGWNYGWDRREGSHPYEGDSLAGLVDPVAEYSHGTGCSVTGGRVVRAAELPEWSGVYLYGDYCTGVVWGLLRGSDGSWSDALLYDTNFTISSFGSGLDGAIYLVDHAGGVYRLTPASATP